MTQINWNLLQNGGQNALAYFNTGMQMGQQARAAQDQRATQNALGTILGGGTTSQMPGPIGGYAGGTFDMNGKPVTPVQSNSDTDAAWATIARTDPRLAMQLRGQMQNQEAARQKAAQEAQGQRDDYIANAAFQLVTLPEEQRGAAWDNYIQQGASRFPELAEYRGQYSPERLNSIVAQAGQMQKYQQYQQPDYVPVGEGGLSGFQYGRPIMQGGQTQDFGAPGAQPTPQAATPTQARIIPQRPANMTNDQLWAQAHEAVRSGANADDVFRQLQAWGVNP